MKRAEFSTNPDTKNKNNNALGGLCKTHIDYDLERVKRVR